MALAAAADVLCIERAVSAELTHRPAAALGVRPDLYADGLALHCLRCGLSPPRSGCTPYRAASAIIVTRVHHRQPSQCITHPS